MRAIVSRISSPRYLASKLLSPVWRGVYWSPVSPLRCVTDWAPPTLPAADWVAVRPILGGVCGSDMAMVLMKNPPDSFAKAFVSSPFVMGHENVSRVTELGGAVEGIEVGDRVNVEPSLSCRVRGVEPVCSACAEGLISSCHNLTAGRLPAGMAVGFNAATGGAWSEAMVAHRSQLYRVPDGLSDEQAVLVDPLACSLHAVLGDPPRDDQTVLIIGAGIVGLGVLAAIRALGLGTRVVVIGRYGFQKDLCIDRGADAVVLPADLARSGLYEYLGNLLSTPVYKGMFGKPILMGGADMVFDTIGSRNTTEDSLRICRSGGTVMIVGMGHARWVDWDPVTYKQLRIRGAHGRGFEKNDPAGQGRHTYEIMHELMLDGLVKTDGLLTHTFPLADYRHAFQTVLRKGPTGCVKAAFRV
jgi:threonine dehydrogenase-like Zn-dependent dehydrogenase